MDQMGWTYASLDCPLLPDKVTGKKLFSCWVIPTDSQKLN